MKLVPLLPGIPSPDEVSRAAANVYDRLVRGHLADLRPMPASIIDEGPQRTVYRYHPSAHAEPTGGPVLLVPPLAAPALCFDLRRGCSMAQHLVGTGHRTYLVDYGWIAFADRELGLEHWVYEVLPEAIRRVSEDAGGEPVHLVGWCLGGIMALLSVADDPDLPVADLSLVASPFDYTKVPMVAPLRPLVDFTGGRIISALYHVMGGAPAPLVQRAYQLAGFDKYVTKPFAVLRNLHDRDFLAQIEAVDRFMDGMLAYPGRTFGQLYHRFFRANDLADGRIALGDRTIALDAVKVPVLSIAGTGDGIAPLPAVHALGGLLSSTSVQLESAPGGHLGVLTGRAAKSTTWKTITGFIRRQDDARNRPARHRPKARPRRAAAA